MNIQKIARLLILTLPLFVSSTSWAASNRFVFSAQENHAVAKETSAYVFNPNDTHHRLSMPAGKGPFPAVLILHASAGIEKSHTEWAQLLNKAGYVVYIIDSFTPRGYKDRGAMGWEKATQAQLSDLDPAYHYLANLPQVKAEHIGVLGFSMGGYDALLAKQAHTPFKAAASFYGVCKMVSPHTQLKGPLKIFIGENDDRSTTTDCEALVQKNQKMGEIISINLYPGAKHGFDNADFRIQKEFADEKGQKYHIEFNEMAKRHAARDLIAFFNQYLK